MELAILRTEYSSQVSLREADLTQRCLNSWLQTAFKIAHLETTVRLYLPNVVVALVPAVVDCARESEVELTAFVVVGALLTAVLLPS